MDYFRNEVGGCHHLYDANWSDEEISKRLEEGLFSNVMLNLFFCRGLKLASPEGLIDSDKLYELVSALKKGQRDRYILNPAPEEP